MTELARLGLTGSFQTHVAPVVLMVDDRAHQVFEGFGAQTGTTLLSLRHRLESTAGVWIVPAQGEPFHCPFEEALRREWPSDDVAVVPAVSREFAGGLYGLVAVVDRLLGPGGCPWDQAQTHDSLKRHLIEEAYELIDAIDKNDEPKMIEELGDVLLQPLMHAQMEALAGNWDIDTVAKGITDKLVRRHPHVFGDLDVADADEVLKNWDAIKSNERGGETPDSILEGVPKAMPALLRAFEVSKRAARAGFEWPDLEGVWDKFREEEHELKEAIAANEGVADELGDLLFTVVNLARWLKVEPEDALRVMVDRFTERFQQMETLSAKPLQDLSPNDWDELWNQAKSL